MKLPFLKHFTIRQWVLLISILPLLLITLLLGGYFIHTQLEDADNSLRERGEAMSQLMASAAEFGLLTSNKEMLKTLLQHPNKNPDVADIVFLTPEFRVILRADPFGPLIRADQAYPYFTDRYLYFLQPVIATGIDVLDSPEYGADEASAPRIGWVTVVLSRAETKARQQEIILKGVLIALVGLLITLMLALRFGRQITNPILHITDVVEQLEQGKLDVRTTQETSGELRSLSRGINRLATRVKESNRSLETQVDQTTGQLRSMLEQSQRQNLELMAARKKADGANRTKDDFLARMSHELRTPLTSVLGFSRLLDQTELGPEQKEYTRIINQTSSLLLSIIDDILDFSKLQSNAIQLENLQINIDALVSDIIEMQAPTAHAKGLELVPIVAAELPEVVYGDPMRLRQILTNLISNAIKFTKQGHVLLRVYLQGMGDGRVTLLFEVEDTGIGIPNNRLRTLFQAFAQADTSITRRFGGSGLGLVIARLLAELMEGSIELKSEEGAGTTVSVTLPLTCPLEQPAPERFDSPTVLLYDSHPLNRRNLKNQLHRLAPKPISANSWEELLRRVEEHSSATVIWGLEPGVTVGSEFQQQLAELYKLKPARIILLSCEYIDTELPPGIDVLRKPVRTNNLYHALLPDQFSPPKEALLPESGTQLPLRILMAEDNDFNRLLISRILEQAGAEVIPTTNGEDVIRQAQRDQFDLILMDVHMPKVDGIQATEVIRRRDPDIPIIALTANVIASEHQRLLNAGANKVLLKPINDHELKHTINGYCRRVTLETRPDGETHTTVVLEDYQISKDVLHKELQTQLAGMHEGFEKRSSEQMRHHSHQILGLAGLYELPELEMVGIELNRAIKQEDIKKTWDALWRLQRMIEHSQY